MFRKFSVGGSLKLSFFFFHCHKKLLPFPTTLNIDMKLSMELHYEDIWATYTHMCICKSLCIDGKFMAVVASFPTWIAYCIFEWVFTNLGWGLNEILRPWGRSFIFKYGRGCELNIEEIVGMSRIEIVSKIKGILYRMCVTV